MFITVTVKTAMPLGKSASGEHYDPKPMIVPLADIAGVWEDADGRVHLQLRSLKLSEHHIFLYESVADVASKINGALRREDWWVEGHIKRRTSS